MSHKSSNTPSQPRKLKSARNGFTLIELLMVFGVISILAAITFGISQGVQNSQNRAKAKVQLAAISQALEQFKATHGDYPWVDNDPELLLQSLLGWTEFETSGGNLAMQVKSVADVPASGPKPFLDISKLDYTGTLPGEPNVLPDNIALTDPWDESYVYVYKTSATGSWDNFGYVLYTVGPDLEDVPVGGDGVLTDSINTDPLNIDNIYAGEL